MNKINHVLTLLILCVTARTADAQSQEQTTPTPLPVQVTGTTPPTRKPVGDDMLSERLSRDLNSRNADTQTKTIQWYETDYGYTGNYVLGSAYYMARYDQQGNYVETLRRTNWSNATVPASLANAYNQSPYKDYTITSYWSVIDSGKSGYYLELRDNTGTRSAVWADSQGNFTTAPYSSTTASSGNIPKD